MYFFKFGQKVYFYSVFFLACHKISVMIVCMFILLSVLDNFITDNKFKIYHCFLFNQLITDNYAPHVREMHTGNSGQC